MFILSFLRRRLINPHLFRQPTCSWPTCPWASPSIHWECSLPDMDPLDLYVHLSVHALNRRNLIACLKVKIMWPRSDNNPAGPGGDITARRGKAAGMSGFVSYMTRKSAEECVREMDGFSWGGCVLRVGWSKAVPIAAKPAYGACRSTRIDDPLG